MTPSERTREILRKVRQVEIRSRRFVDESLVGAYHSVFKGRGMEFDEVRDGGSRYRIEASPIVTRALSPVDVLSKLNHWENGFDPRAYRPPASAETAADLVDGAGSLGRCALRRLVLDVYRETLRSGVAGRSQ